MLYLHTLGIARAVVRADCVHNRHPDRIVLRRQTAVPSHRLHRRPQQQVRHERGRSLGRTRARPLPGFERAFAECVALLCCAGHPIPHCAVGRYAGVVYCRRLSRPQEGLPQLQFIELQQYDCAHRQARGSYNKIETSNHPGTQSVTFGVLICLPEQLC